MHVMFDVIWRIVDIVKNASESSCKINSLKTNILAIYEIQTAKSSKPNVENCANFSIVAYNYDRWKLEKLMKLFFNFNAHLIFIWK